MIKQHEKNFLLLILPSSTLLCYLRVYFVQFPFENIIVSRECCTNSIDRAVLKAITTQATN